MKPEIHYPLEKLREAVHDLATGPGDVRSRLLVAYGRFWHLTTDRFPRSVRRDVAWIRRQLTRGVPATERDRVRSALAKMRNTTGSKIAKRIHDVYVRLCELGDQ